MAKKVEFSETDTATGLDRYNVYEILGMKDEFDKDVKVKQYKETVTKGDVELRKLLIEEELTELNGIIVDINNIEKAKVV